MSAEPAVIHVEEGRFARFEAIQWWRQDLLARRGCW